MAYGCFDIPLSAARTRNTDYLHRNKKKKNVVKTSFNAVTTLDTESTVEPLVSLAVKECCGLLASFHYSGQCYNPFYTTKNALCVCCTCVSERECVWHVIGPKCLGITLWCACQIHLSSHTTYQCGSAISALPAEVWGEQQHRKRVTTSHSRNHNGMCWLNVTKYYL